MEDHGSRMGGKEGRAREGAPGGLIPLTALQPAPSSCLDLGAIRERLAGLRGREYWRSLEELADTEEFRQYLQREFPRQAPREMAPLSRREFMRVMGATLALAGVGGCAYQPPEKIVPYVEQPEELIPGKPLYFATAYPRGGYAYGVLAESHMGRPIKLDGNPDHPATLGASDAFLQASLLNLYDPDRSQAVRFLGNITTWENFLGAMDEATREMRRTAGAGVRVVTETITSPTLAAQLRRFLARYPGARIHPHEPVGQDTVREGATLAFGTDVHPVYHFDRAARILALDADFLSEDPGSVRYAREFGDGRRVRADRTTMNRLYVVESTPTMTGSAADHRLVLRPSQIEAFARAVAAALGAGGAGAGGAAAPEGVPGEWIPALVKDLQAHRGRSLVVAGAHQPPVVHALAHAMNEALGNVGTTVTFTAPVEARFPGREGTLRELVDALNAGRVQTVIILSSNPVYTAPADLNFAGALQNEKVSLRLHLGLYDDETAALCQWHVPESHFLEAWGDARAYDGTVSIIQPLIRPLYSSRSAHELLAVLLGDGDRDGYDIVREYWMTQDPRFRAAGGAGAGAAGAAMANGAGAAGGGAAAGRAGAAGAGVAGGTGGTAAAGVEAAGSGMRSPAALAGGAAGAAASEAFEKFWHNALHTGIVPGTAAPARPVTVRAGFAAGGAGAGGAATPDAPALGAEGGGGMEIIFRPDPTIWDGRFANNAWLQELPKPLTKLTWDNAALISPRTAEANNLDNRDMVELTYHGRTLRVPVWISPGHPDNAVTLTLGYGRTRVGRVGADTGFNAYALRTSDAPWFGTGLQMRKVGGRYQLVSTQTHFNMENRDVVRSGDLQDFAANPRSPAFMHTHHEGGEQPSLYPPMWPSDRLGPDEQRPIRDERIGTATRSGEEGGEAHPGSTVTHDSQGREPDAATVGPEGQPAHPQEGHGESLRWEGAGYNGLPIPAWGMVIDLNACVGCGACTLSCQAENNIATVGKDQVAMNREMHWLRVDTYYTGSLENPETVNQPVLCMHCEKAPCEPVCPVQATSHNAEGINEQTYNRCVGTRYCQNNCPYKVRRFNYLQYSDQKTPTIQMMRNPDVTVRSRGVMEKCTYCVQRINQARMEAEKEDRPIRDGDVVTACQQACPTRAIVFGNVNDTASNGGRGSLVRQLKQEPLNYGLLTELNTNPRTSYLARLRNPNPELAGAEAARRGAPAGAGHEQMDQTER